MSRWHHWGLAGLVLSAAACQTSGRAPIAGHNHPEGVTVPAPADGPPAAVALAQWRLVVAGAT